MTRSNTRRAQEQRETGVTADPDTVPDAQPRSQTLPPPSPQRESSGARTLEDLRREEQELDEEIAREQLASSVREKQAQLARLREARIAPAREPNVVPDPPRSPEGTAPSVLSATASPAPRASHFSARTKAPCYKGGQLSSLRAYIFDIEQTFSAGRAAGELLTEEERVAYAIRCIEGAPKLRVLNYAAGQGLEPTQLTWAELKDHLLSYYSDPETRALTAMERLGRISQAEWESVMDFIDRVEQIEIDLPQQESEASRVGLLLSKFRPEIRFHLSISGTAYATRARLISSARRIEEALRGQRRAGSRAAGPPGAGPRATEPRAAEPPTAPLNPNHIPVGSGPTYPRESDGRAAPQKRPADDDSLGDARAKGLCFNCNKPGHFSAHCPESRAPLTRCYTCGEAGHVSNRCPNAVCRRCNQKGHTAVRCTANTDTAHVARVARESSGDADRQPRQFRVKAKLWINKSWKTIEAIIDSGAEANLIHRDVVAALQPSQDDPPPALAAINGTPLQPEGTYPLMLRLSDSLGTQETQRHSFVAAAFDGPPLILGLPWLESVDPVIQWSQRQWRFPIYRHQLALATTHKQLRSSLAVAVVLAHPDKTKD